MAGFSLLIDHSPLREGSGCVKYCSEEGVEIIRNSDGMHFRRRAFQSIYLMQSNGLFDTLNLSGSIAIDERCTPGKRCQKTLSKLRMYLPKRLLGAHQSLKIKVF